MKTTYHLCWSGGDELLFRTREDYIHGIICLCIACYETGNNLLAYCLMSNHVHICVRGDNIKALIKAFRYSYTRYFNSKYRRRGKLGERDFFKLEIHGLHHLLTAIAYILRNPLHHGICDTPSRPHLPPNLDTLQEKDSLKESSHTLNCQVDTESRLT